MISKYLKKTNQAKKKMKTFISSCLTTHLSEAQLSIENIKKLPTNQTQTENQSQIKTNTPAPKS